MRYTNLIMVVGLLTGCSSLRRITDGKDVHQQDPQVIRDVQLGPTPSFNVPTPAAVLHALIPIGGAVSNVSAANIRVFMKDDVSGQWFELGAAVSPAFYYTRAGSTVQFYGTDLPRKEYCIYEYAN